VPVPVDGRYPQANENGVYLEEDCEVLTLPGPGTAGASARILLVEIGPARWLGSVSYSMHSGDYRSTGSLPSLAARHGPYPDRTTALRSTVGQLSGEMERIAGHGVSGTAKRARGNGAQSGVSAAETAEARRVLHWASHLVSDLVGGPAQLELSLT
jgi:hypothetical protein